MPAPPTTSSVEVAFMMVPSTTFTPANCAARALACDVTSALFELACMPPDPSALSSTLMKMSVPLVVTPTTPGMAKACGASSSTVMVGAGASSAAAGATIRPLAASAAAAPNALSVALFLNRECKDLPHAIVATTSRVLSGLPVLPQIQCIFSTDIALPGYVHRSRFGNLPRRLRRKTVSETL